jgi:superfamily II DNA or RNA helicase
MLDIRWGTPYSLKEGNSTKWRREWCIPKEYLEGFFGYWQKNKSHLHAQGFSVYKSTSTGKWYLFETKNRVEQFKGFTGGGEKKTYKPIPVFDLPPYTIKETQGLRPWQVVSASRLVSSIKYWGAAIDGSDTGTGKTYTACAVARDLGYNVVVVCPKAVIKSWTKVLGKHFKMGKKVIGIVNYERLRVGKKDSQIASLVLDRKTKKHVFKWKIPTNTLIIWDESQKLKNWDTKNAKMCEAARKAGYPMLFCSATNATSPLEMRAIGLALKMFKTGEYGKWCSELGVYDGRFGKEFDNDPQHLKYLHATTFEHRGVRLRRDTIPGFPQCEVIPEILNMDDQDTHEINRIYDDMEKELERHEKHNKEGDSQMVIQLRARQRIELIKVPLIVDMVEDAMEQGFSVAIFVNFTETINALAQRLNTKCIFDGKHSDKDRDKSVEDFQDDKERIILVNVQSGGAGLSLHDLNGRFPRMSIISPSFSAVHMRQALGRIWRDDAKTKAIQKIVCVANTVEENVCHSVQQKLDNLDLLNDGDLQYAKNYEIIRD